jgi:hypothetical protein
VRGYVKGRADERAAADERDEFSSSWFTHLAAVTKRAEAAEAALTETRLQTVRIPTATGTRLQTVPDAIDPMGAADAFMFAVFGREWREHPATFRETLTALWKFRDVIRADERAKVHEEERILRNLAR